MLWASFALAAAACTDYDADAGSARNQPFVSNQQSSFSGSSSGAAADASSRAGADAGHRDPFVPIDSWAPPVGPDAGSTDAGSTDAGGTDAGSNGAGDTAAALHGVSWGGGVHTMGGGGDTCRRVEAGGHTDPDSGGDAGSAGSDAASADAWQPDTAPVDKTSCVGRCGLYHAGGSCQCDKGCVSFGDCCPDYQKLCVDKDPGTPDAGKADAGSADAGGIDTGKTDAGKTDAGKTDAGKTDAGTTDAGPFDAGPFDGETAYTGPADAGMTDAASDTTHADGVKDDSLADSGPADSGPADSGPADAYDAGDSTWYPDWQGYPDASYPDGADIFGGVMKSCKLLYFAVFDENCKGKDLTAECIDKEASVGSLQARFLFSPLKDCVKANCIKPCQGAANTGDCVQECLGKHCAYPFFACLTEGEGGQNDCPTTLQCLEKPEYKDKIFKIATHCFGNAKHAAQKQVADFFACGQEPQTKSCFGEIATCYNTANPTASCSATIGCADICDKQGKGEACVFECIGKADADAVKLLDAVQQCQLDNCQDCNGPKGCGDSCSGKYCSAHWGACMADK